MERKKQKNSRSDGAFAPQNAWDKPRPELNGLPYINWLRCSNLTQGDTSPEGQKLVNDGFASIHQMHWVLDHPAEGVSGSQTFNRQDIQDLLELHRTVDFDVVLVHDLSRVTRGGIRHGNAVEDLLKKHGIRLISTTEFIPDGPEGDLLKSVKHYSNQLLARGISASVARGLSLSLARNAKPAAGHNPYGLDRLYVGPDGKPRMLIRWDGPIQRWLRPDTLEEVGQRIKPPRVKHSKNPMKRQRPSRTHRERFKGYVKQQDETSRLVPGSKERRDVLVFMFTNHFIQHWGYHRIAHHLNDERHVPGPEGGKWNLKTVRSILYNPIYLGIEVRHRWKGALYNMITESGTAPVFVDQDQLEQDKRTGVPHEERPREDWKLVDVPELKEMLPSPLREIAAERVMKQFDPTVPPHPKKGKPLHTGPAKHKHLDSPFLLTYILHSKQTGHWLRGEVACKKRADGTPYVLRYYFDGGAAVHGERGVNTTRIPAGPVEDAVLGVVEQLLGASQEVADRVRQTVATVAEERPEQDARREALVAEQEALSSRLRQAYKLLGKAGCDAVAEEIENDSGRLEEVNRQLKAMKAADAVHAIDVEQAVKNVQHRIDGLRQRLRGLCNAELKLLLAAMVDGLQIDLVTHELSFTIVLPDWMQAAIPEDDGNAAQAESGTFRLDWQLPWSLPAKTNLDAAGTSGSLVLSQWTCQRPKKDCYTCSRGRRAA